MELYINREEFKQTVKLFLNNLYGKNCSNTDSVFKEAYVREIKRNGFAPVHKRGIICADTDAIYVVKNNY